VRNGQIASAFAAEATALANVAAGLADADLDRVSPCPPWNVGELLCHMLIAVRRMAEVQADAGPGELVTAAGYFRPGERFSAAVNSDRIEAARALARSLGSAAAIFAAFDAAWPEAHAILTASPADTAIRTRHGDRMLLVDFARTRVVELALHGLDLAAGLGRPPWMTAQAASVLEDLLIPDGSAAPLRAALSCDQAGLIARITGRLPLPAGQADLLRAHGVTRLALG
jgi:uncharacterized protein (TIGR03083 family)